MYSFPMLPLHTDEKLHVMTCFNDVNRALPYPNPDLDRPDIIDTKTI